MNKAQFIFKITQWSEIYSEGVPYRPSVNFLAGTSLMVIMVIPLHWSFGQEFNGNPLWRIPGCSIIDGPHVIFIFMLLFFLHIANIYQGSSYERKKHKQKCLEKEGA